MTLRIFGWAADEAGCGYYRVNLPLIGLHEKYNAQVAANTTLKPGDWARYDAIIGQRVCTPGPSLTWETMAQAGVPLVFEIDDLLTHVDYTNSKQAYDFYRDPGHRKMLLSNIRKATVVTVSTAPLADHMRQYNPNVVVLENCVHEAIFEHPVNERTDERVTIGWCGGNSHAADIGTVKHAIESVMADNDVTFHTIGTPYGKDWDIDQERYEFRKWQENIANYYSELNFDIGIAPLRSSTFNECKSAIKVIEYGARGIPTVASDFGPYARYIEHGHDGYLAKNHRDWVRYLSELINDDAARKEMGENAKAKARQRTIQSHAHRYYELFKPYIGRYAQNGAAMEKIEVSEAKIRQAVQAQHIDSQRFPN